MKNILKILSFLGLATTAIPPFLLFAGTIDNETNAFLMMIGTILWFATAPFWMNKK